MCAMKTNELHYVEVLSGWLCVGIGPTLAMRALVVVWRNKSWRIVAHTSFGLN